ncbi:hypothetical protein pb186bvf_009797 [Paramecium bursaria]
MNKITENIELHRAKQLVIIFFMKNKIIKVGDDGFDQLKKDIPKIVEIISENFQQNKQELRDAIANSLVQAITLLPLKAGIYATIMGLLSVKQTTSAFADTIIQGIIDQLQNIQSCKTPILGQTIMRFLAELMNIGLVSPVSFVECLYDLESGAESEQSPFYLQILLSTLPHSMIKSLDKNQIEFKNIIQNVELLMTKRQSKDWLDTLWHSIRKYLNQNNSDNTSFMKNSYPRPYYLFVDDLAQIKPIRRSFKIPIIKRSQIWIPQQCAVLDSRQDVQLEITRLWIYETIELFKKNRNQLVFQFKSYTQLQKLTQAQESQYHQILVNVIMNSLLDSTYRGQESSIFYSGLLANIQNEIDSKEIYDYIEGYIDQCPLNSIYRIEKLSDFVSHVYANSQIKNLLDRLYSRINQDETELGFYQNYFATVSFRKLFQLVVIDKVRDLIPKELNDWYSNDITKPQEIKETDISENINSLLQQKTPAIEMIEKLQALPGDGEKKITVFSESLIVQMFKSITHLNVLSRRYLSLLQQPKLVTQEKFADLFLSAIFNIMSHSTFHLKVYFKEFLQLEVINSLQLIKWMLNMISPKQKYQDAEETSKQFNLITAVQDVFRKLIPIEALNDCTYQNTLELINQIEQFNKLCNDLIIINALEDIVCSAALQLRQVQKAQADKLVKELNNQNLTQLFMSLQ